jgi:hypothetical protein
MSLDSLHRMPGLKRRSTERETATVDAQTD